MQKMNQSSDGNPLIKIPQGILEGFVLRSRLRKDYFGFYGIPYGKAERFELPKKWESWNGTMNATKAKDRCIQFIPSPSKRFIGAENCHYLNVFTPVFPLLDPDDVKGCPPVVPSEQFPVIVFIHGGGFLNGGGDLFGNKFLVDEGVILVTINYRLSAFGFINFGEGPANLGLHDQVMALKWINENIQYFSGDKYNVTLMGESAGAACVHFHMLSPLSTGLFSKAILQSGSALCPWAFNYAPAEKLKKLLKQLDINGFSNSNKTEVITKLRRLDAKAIAAQRLNYDSLKEEPPIIHFAPSIESGPDNDRKFLTDSPVKLLYCGQLINEVPHIIGVNGQEGLYRALPILRDPMKVKALNDHWSHELPKHLMYKKDSISQHDDIPKILRKYYFDSKPIVSPDSPDAREKLTNMISDRLFNYPVRKTALLHRSLIKDAANKIFLYHFEYCGDYSFCNGFEVRETYGASHADELQYLMNQRVFYSKISPGSQADHIIDKMVGLWGSFAKTGIPSHPRQTHEWTPLPSKNEVQAEGLKYFNINMEDSMIDEPFTDRMEFWDHLPNPSF